jgi:hypothetical protein
MPKSVKNPRVTQPMKLKPLNLMATNPLREQFAPTDAQPIRQRARMGGDPTGDSEASPGQQFIQKVRDVNAAKGDSRGIKRNSDKSLQGQARQGSAAAKSEIIRRINDPVR